MEQSYLYPSTLSMAAPLKASEMKKMEQGGDALFKEITAGLKGVSEDEY